MLIRTRTRALRRRGPDPPTGTNAPVVPRFRTGSIQHVYREWVPMKPVKYTTSSGAFDTNYSVQAANVTAFSTRFAAVFDEYRFLKVKFVLIPLYAGTTPGATCFALDENDATALGSVAAGVQKVGSKVLTNFCGAYKGGFKTITWSARDTADLQFLSTTNTTTLSVALKLVTDTTVLGSPSAQDLWAIAPVALMEFRGFTT